WPVGSGVGGIAAFPAGSGRLDRHTAYGASVRREVPAGTRRAARRRTPPPGPRRCTAHETIVRNMLERHGGHVFDTSGDAMRVPFSTPAVARHRVVCAQGLASPDQGHLPFWDCRSRRSWSGIYRRSPQTFGGDSYYVDPTFGR